MVKKLFVQIHDDPRIVWLPPILLLLSLLAAQLNEPGAYQAAFALAAGIGTFIVYGLHAADVHGFSGERNLWRRNSLSWLSMASAALGWGLLYIFLTYRLIAVCSAPLSAVLYAWMLTLRTPDLLLLLIALIGITGQAPRLLGVGREWNA